MDRRIPDQQNLSRIGLAIVIIRAPNSQLGHLRPFIPDVLRALEAIQPGQYCFVGPA
jgi:hypothetical protein